MPIELRGKKFDRQTIQENRLVAELRPSDLPERDISDGVFPLLESAVNDSRLVFPTDRFRINQRMEFINSDTNKTDGTLTEMFTNALAEKGFRFPGRFAGGKLTVLKPFDEGVFLLDADGYLFHVKRENGKPAVARTSVDPSLGVRLKVSENPMKEFYGILVTKDSRVFMLGCDGYQLSEIPADGFDADKMDFKIIINPLFRTAVYSDSKNIHALVMDSSYSLIRSYGLEMNGTKPSEAELMLKSLLPFGISFSDGGSRYFGLHVETSPVGFASSVFAGILVLFVVSRFFKTRIRMSVYDVIFVSLTGVYGLAAVLLLPDDSRP